VAHVMIEFLVLLLCDVVPGTQPESASAIRGLVLVIEEDRDCDMIGVFGYDVPKPFEQQEVVFPLLEIDDDIGAARILRRFFDRELAAAVGFPAPAFSAH